MSLAAVAAAVNVVVVVAAGVRIGAGRAGRAVCAGMVHAPHMFVLSRVRIGVTIERHEEEEGKAEGAIDRKNG